MKELFVPGWWKALLVGVACGVAFHLLCGCSSPSVSEPKYPEYDKWWACEPVVRETVTTNDVLVLGADGKFYVEPGVVSVYSYTVVPL